MNNTDRAWAATRKGPCGLRRRGGRWHVERSSFLGEPVTTPSYPEQPKDDSGVPWNRVLVWALERVGAPRLTPPRTRVAACPYSPGAADWLPPRAIEHPLETAA